MKLGVFSNPLTIIFLVALSGVVAMLYVHSDQVEEEYKTIADSLSVKLSNKILLDSSYLSRIEEKTGIKGDSLGKVIDSLSNLAKEKGEGKGNGGNNSYAARGGIRIIRDTVFMGGSGKIESKTGSGLASGSGSGKANVLNKMRSMKKVKETFEGLGYSINEEIVKYSLNKLKDNTSNVTIEFHHLDRNGERRDGKYPPVKLNPGEKDVYYQTYPGDEGVEIVMNMETDQISVRLPLKENKEPKWQKNMIVQGVVSPDMVARTDVSVAEIVVTDPDTKIEDVSVVLYRQIGNLFKIQRDEKQKNKFYLIIQKQEKNWEEKFVDDGILQIQGSVPFVDMQLIVSDNVPGRAVLRDKIRIKFGQ
jgi:hypothetical protein